MDPTHGQDDDDEDPDRAAFRRAVAGVRPLTARSRVAAPPRPEARARFTRTTRAEVLRESLDAPPDPAAPGPGGPVSFRRPAVREGVLRKLQRGRFAIEAEIDLHGLGREAAHAALREFVNESVLQGLRCVRVIHGKGLRSGPGGPVIRHFVDHWLRRSENVLAFASARPADGGTGAVYVLLTDLTRPAADLSRKRER